MFTKLLKFSKHAPPIEALLDGIAPADPQYPAQTYFFPVRHIFFRNGDVSLEDCMVNWQTY